MDEELKKGIKMLYEIMADPELAETIAKMMKNIVDALIKVGFTKEEAIQIATNFSIKNK